MNKYLKNMMFLMLATMMLVSCDWFESTPAPTPVPDPSELSTTDQVVSFPETGGVMTITIRSNTSWTASCSTPGIDVTPSYGTGTKQVRITAQKNTTGESLFGYIYFVTDDNEADCMVNLKQAGSSKSSKDISGTYVGTLKPIGYSDAPARAYVTLTRLSSSSVRVTSLICEEFGLDMNPVNLTVTAESDGSFSLQSETTKSIQGTCYAGKLTLSFSTSLATFYFSGTLD